MAWIVEPREISIDGKPTGTHRLIAVSATDVYSLCEHAHDTPQAAAECPVAIARAAKITHNRVESREAMERDEYERLKKKFE